MKGKGYIVYLLLGSNLPLNYNGKVLKPRNILAIAKERLRCVLSSPSNDNSLSSFSHGHPLFSFTKVVKTKPIGEFKDTPEDFYNQIVVLETRLSPMKVLAATQRIEREFGRKRSGTLLKEGSDKKVSHLYESRSIDIDILQIFKITNAINGCKSEGLKEVYRNSPKLQLPHPQIISRPFVGELLSALRVTNGD